MGKMLCLAAKQMGLYVTVLDPTPKCPAWSVSDEQIIAGFKDEAAILSLAEKSDVLTFEIELANSDVLKRVQQNGCLVHPSPKTLHTIQSKLRQKKFLQQNGLPVPLFFEINSSKELQQRVQELGGKAMLKMARDSYDGRGNFVADSATNLPELYEKLRGNELFLEEWIDFEKELSVMVARNEGGDVAVYPVAENIHSNSILDTSIVPARVPVHVQEEVKKMAEKTMRHLEGAGVFGIECFWTKEGTVLINEIAPRVHNSGHFSIEACKTSQFEQHVRAILNLPLGSTELLQPAVMVNILGTKTGAFRPDGLNKILGIEGTNMHVYGKKESRPLRKMGHVTILDADLERALKKASLVKEILAMEGV